MSDVTEVKKSNASTFIALALVGIVINQIFWSWNDRKKEDYNNTPAGLAELAIEHGRKVDVPLAKAKKASRGRLGAFDTVPVEVVGLTTFTCTNEGEREAGFSRGVEQAIVRLGVEYRLPQGCAVVRVDTHIHSLSGGSYLFKEVNSNIGCGTMNGRNDSVTECAQFLYEHHGIPVKYFGYGVSINH